MRRRLADGALQEGERPQPPVRRAEEQDQHHRARLQLSSLQEQGAPGSRCQDHPRGGEESRGTRRASGQLDGVVEGGGGRGGAGEGGERPPGEEGGERLLAGGSPGSAGEGHRARPGAGEEGAAVVVPAQLQRVQHLREELPPGRRAAPEEAAAAGDGAEGPVRSAGLDRQPLQEVSERN